jgi:hypothetical protein
MAGLRITLGLAGTLALILVVITSGQGSRQPVIHSVHPSYAEAYDNIVDATRASDVVVVARGKRVLETAESELSPGLVATRFEFNVIKSFKGTAKVNSTIVVKQQGGEAGNIKTIVDGDPLMQTTGTYLFFLKQIVGGPYDGEYFALGGPSGRLLQASSGELSVEGESILKVQKGATVDALASDLSRG